MIEQIELAKTSPSGRHVAIDATMRSLPYIASGLEDNALYQRCRLIFQMRIENQPWTIIAERPLGEFMDTADRLIGELKRLKRFLDDAAGSSPSLKAGC
jgi:hypothetical protein